MFIKSHIEAIRSIEMHKPVRVMILQDLGKTVFSDVDLIKGVEVELPRWLAEGLEKIGYARIQRSLRSLEDLNKIRYQEESRFEESKIELYKISYDMYLESEKIVRDYREKLESKDPRVFQEFEKVKKVVQRILRLRFRKILYLIQVSENIDEDLERKMSLEEKAFYRYFLKGIYQWIKDLERLVIGDDNV
ncbi:MAG: hypothetical protein QXJ51_02210 [Sulfolobales archaeon]